MRRGFRWHRARGVALCVILSVVLGGCADGVPAETESTPAPIITEHRALTGVRAERALGEDCSSGSHNECASALCLHVAAEPDAPHRARYVCSRICSTTKDCPSPWRCVRPNPGEKDGVCVP